MKDRVSIRDLAKSAGVSRTTVSLALRDSHKISLAVRKRIQELADVSDAGQRYLGLGSDKDI